jgi:hypothetical protein
MNDEPKKSPALALTLAFAPTVMVLAIIGLAFLAEAKKFTLPQSPGWIVLLCLGSGICCFTSSIMLFRRKTGLAIFGGILFLLLNGFITFFFGCTAMLSGI